MGKLVEIVRVFAFPIVDIGNTNISEILPNKKVKIDSGFQAFLDSDSEPVLSTASSEVMGGLVFRTNKSNNRDHTIMMEFGRENLTPSVVVVRSFLNYLGSEKGFSILDIPKKKYEVNLILGYNFLSGHPKVLFIEHELDMEEIHLHARDLNHWVVRTPMVALFKNV